MNIREEMDIFEREIAAQQPAPTYKRSETDERIEAAIKPGMDASEVDEIVNRIDKQIEREEEDAEIARQETMKDFNGNDIHKGDVLISRRSGQEYTVLGVEADRVMVKSWVNTSPDEQDAFPLETCYAFIVKG